MMTITEKFPSPPTTQIRARTVQKTEVMSFSNYLGLIQNEALNWTRLYDTKRKLVYNNIPHFWGAHQSVTMSYGTNDIMIMKVISLSMYILPGSFTAISQVGTVQVCWPCPSQSMSQNVLLQKEHIPPLGPRVETLHSRSWSAPRYAQIEVFLVHSLGWLIQSHSAIFGMNIPDLCRG